LRAPRAVLKEIPLISIPGHPVFCPIKNSGNIGDYYLDRAFKDLESDIQPVFEF